MRFTCSVTLIALTVCCMSLDAVRAQAPAARPSFLQFLGVNGRAFDSVVNRRGNLPGLERKGELGRVKRIADPSFLPESALEPPQLLQTAAEIKLQEDLAPQKIKAIKFLATIGCGCYDKEGKVTAAFLEALKDCTPDVKLQAIESLGEIAGEYCQFCNEVSCCKPDIAKKLDEIANGQDEKGCWLEPSAEIRAAAAEALCACGPVYVGSEVIEPKVNGDGENGEGTFQDSENGQATDAQEVSVPSPRAFRQLPAAPRPLPLSQLQGKAPITPVASRPSPNGMRRAPRPSQNAIAIVSDQKRSQGINTTAHRQQINSNATSRRPTTPQRPEVARRPILRHGVVERVDTKRRLVVLRFKHQDNVAKGTPVAMTHSTMLSDDTAKFRGEIVHFEKGIAVVRPFHAEAIAHLSRGDAARMFERRIH